MAKVYVVHQDGSTESLPGVRCVDEDKELQRVLEKNPDLIPGEQINPDDPRRWLIIKREMPVPDPNSGSDRWSIDFLLADQDAMPTFVECKRFNDTRSRREVVGQVLEYAANGQFYWTKDQLRNLAEETLKQSSLTLDGAIRTLNPPGDLSIDAFFDRFQANLQEGQVRIVFFLEESPFELRSIVDFLNKQMELAEVLIVEARQYSRNELRIIVPSLFGYTEQARLIKKSVTVTSAASRRKWDQASFLNDARAKIGDNSAEALQSFLDACVAIGAELAWGTGATKGSFTLRIPALCQPSLFTVYSDGDMSVNFGGLNDKRGTEAVRELFAEKLDQIGFEIPADRANRYPMYGLAQWISKAPLLIDSLKQMLPQSRAKEALFEEAARCPPAGS